MCGACPPLADYEGFEIANGCVLQVGLPHDLSASYAADSATPPLRASSGGDLDTEQAQPF